MTMLINQLPTKCLGRTYIGSSISFQVVSADKIPWDVPFPEYAPNDYTSPSIKKKGQVWADNDDPNECRFNEDDKAVGVSRISHHGNYQISSNGRPLNPIGRTGISGRGILGRWGVNHAADPVVSRFHKGELQFVAIKRSDTGEWAFPGGFVDKGENANQTFRREFTEEVLGGDTIASLDAGFWDTGCVLYKGYCNDHRNTDNAWIETIAKNFHDSKGLFDDILLKASDDAVEAKWIDVKSEPKLYASHNNVLRLLSTMHNVPLSGNK